MTKYGMALTFAPLLGFDRTRLSPDATPPAGAPRPKNAHLDSSALERLGIGQRTPFADALPAILAPHLPNRGERPREPHSTLRNDASMAATREGA